MAPRNGSSIRAKTAMVALHALDANRIGYCVLRNHETIPTEPGRDIDIIVRRADLRRVERIVESIAKSTGWQRLLRCSGHHEGTSFYLIRHESEGVVQLELHFTAVRWGGIAVFSPNEILARRVKSQTGIWIADPAQVAVQRLFQFGLSGQFSVMKDDYWEQTVSALTAATDEVHSLLREQVGGRWASRIVQQVQEGNRFGVGLTMRRLRVRFVMRRLIARPRALPYLVTKSLNRAWEPIRPARCGVVGVAEKNSIAEAVADAVNPLFRTVEIVEATFLDRNRVEQLLRLVNTVGAVLVIASDPERELHRRAWGKTVVSLQGDSSAGIQAVVDRFSNNHHRI